MLNIEPGIIVPDSDLREEFMLSSGPGGQNVNKTSSAVRLYFKFLDSEALSPEQKNLIARKCANRINAEGEIFVEARNSREQLKNRAEAVSRMETMIAAALKKNVKRKKTFPGKAAHERRLNTKKKASDVKKMRSLRKFDTD